MTPNAGVKPHCPVLQPLLVLLSPLAFLSTSLSSAKSVSQFASFPRHLIWLSLQQMALGCPKLLSDSSSTKVSSPPSHHTQDCSKCCVVFLKKHLGWGRKCVQADQLQILTFFIVILCARVFSLHICLCTTWMPDT